MASQIWKNKRAPVLVRAGGRCERCGRTGCVLEVHHRTYERFGGEELPSDLEALCPACHAKADAERRAEICEIIESRRVEAEEALDEARFRGWARAKYGEDFFDYTYGEELFEAHEEYEQWRRDREERAYE